MKKKIPNKTKLMVKRTSKSKDSAALYPTHSDSVMYHINDSQISTLIDLNTGKYFSLNFFGTLIWRLADGTRSLQDIKDALAQRFPIQSKTTDSVDKFLKDLTKQGFIVQRSSKVKGIAPSNFLKDIPKNAGFTPPKLTATKPEPLNVFGMPGGGGGY